MRTVPSFYSQLLYVSRAVIFNIYLCCQPAPVSEKQWMSGLGRAMGSRRNRAMLGINMSPQCLLVG